MTRGGLSLGSGEKLHLITFLSPSFFFLSSFSLSFSISIQEQNWNGTIAMFSSFGMNLCTRIRREREKKRKRRGKVVNLSSSGGLLFSSLSLFLPLFSLALTSRKMVIYFSFHSLKLLSLSLSFPFSTLSLSLTLSLSTNYLAPKTTFLHVFHWRSNRHWPPTDTLRQILPLSLFLPLPL